MVPDDDEVEVVECVDRLKLVHDVSDQGVYPMDRGRHLRNIGAPDVSYVIRLLFAVGKKLVSKRGRASRRRN